MCKLGSRKPMLERINKYKIDPTTECWMWTGSTDKDGYGRLGTIVDGIHKNIRAPRASYEVHIGPIPEGLMVLHRCNTPACINPKHLYAGSSADNMADMVAAGNAGKTKLIGPKNGMHGKVGELNPFYGKNHTEESKAKMRASRIK